MFHCNYILLFILKTASLSEDGGGWSLSSACSGSIIFSSKQAGMEHMLNHGYREIMNTNSIEPGDRAILGPRKFTRDAGIHNSTAWRWRRAG
jgi:hypothetical protein